MLVQDPGDDQNWWSEDSKATRCNTQGPPVMYSTNQTRPAVCVRLCGHVFLGHDAIFYKFFSQRIVAGMSKYRLAIGLSALLFATVILPAQAYAQTPASRVSAVRIPSPKSVLGFSPGDDRTIADWSQITNYFNLLDKASDRVQVQTLGQSTLKRPLIVAFISARENILALEKYKDIQQQLADSRRVNGAAQADRLIATGKS